MAVTDVLIIGSGIAGLSIAIKIAERFPDRKICVITKSGIEESNTRLAQGGIAVVSDSKYDSFEKHVQDTLEAGAGLCHEAVVDHVVREAPERIRELQRWGVEFDKTVNGELLLGMEGGHTAHRIAHCRDATGFQLIYFLLRKIQQLPNITIVSNHCALDLIFECSPSVSGTNSSGICYGAYVLNVKDQKVENYISRVTILATGGIGQLYRVTTNPLIATGDGIAMAFRAGTIVRNMEFVQFHPTAFYSDKESPSFLISEAVRGYGAFLRNKKGERFMPQYSSRAELACRDVVARAIVQEIGPQQNECVYLDCTHLDKDDLIAMFPTIHQQCLVRGIDFTRDFVPVSPAMHYICGGIEVDLSSRTSIENLYACGECAYTGLHGANRLASNSLLEALVFAHGCYKDIEANLDETYIQSAALGEKWQFVTDHVNDFKIAQMRAEMQCLMTNYAGIIRTNSGLMSAQGKLLRMQSKINQMMQESISMSVAEMRNSIDCALLVVHQSLDRKENKGTFFNQDLEIGKNEYNQNKQGVYF